MQLLPRLSWLRLRPLNASKFAVITVVGVLMFLAGCGLSLYYQRHLPTEPVFSLGRTYELDDHGNLVYMTFRESVTLHTLIFGGWIMAAAGVIPKVRDYRKIWKEK